MATKTVFLYELDLIGNVRRLTPLDTVSVPDNGACVAPPAQPELEYAYTAFGRLVTGAQAVDQPLRWQARWLHDIAGGIYDVRARTWSPELGSFLQADDFSYLTQTGTLWSWPGQNPIAFRDPTGRHPAAKALLKGIGYGALAGAISNAVVYSAGQYISGTPITGRGFAGAVVGGGVAGGFSAFGRAGAAVGGGAGYWVQQKIAGEELNGTDFGYAVGVGAVIGLAVNLRPVALGLKRVVPMKSSGCLPPKTASDIAKRSAARESDKLKSGAVLGTALGVEGEVGKKRRADSAAVPEPR